MHLLKYVHCKIQIIIRGSRSLQSLAICGICFESFQCHVTTKPPTAPYSHSTPVYEHFYKSSSQIHSVSYALLNSETKQTWERARAQQKAWIEIMKKHTSKLSSGPAPRSRRTTPKNHHQFERSLKCAAATTIYAVEVFRWNSVFCCLIILGTQLQKLLLCCCHGTCAEAAYRTRGTTELSMNEYFSGDQQTNMRDTVAAARL